MTVQPSKNPVLGVLILYLVKSALGIDLIPGFLFGVWGWFQENVLGVLLNE